MNHGKDVGFIIFAGKVRT